MGSDEANARERHDAIADLDRLAAGAHLAPVADRVAREDTRRTRFDRSVAEAARIAIKCITIKS